MRTLKRSLREHRKNEDILKELKVESSFQYLHQNTEVEKAG